MRIVFENLLSNAIKYGRNEGTIRIDSEASKSGTDANDTVLSVMNEGDGIAPDKVNLLFQKFSRIDNPKHAGKKGTGLGLYICREIIEQHGGKISGESEEGKWTKFTLSLPTFGTTR